MTASTSGLSRLFFSQLKWQLRFTFAELLTWVSAESSPDELFILSEADILSIREQQVIAIYTDLQFLSFFTQSQRATTLLSMLFVVKSLDTGPGLAFTIFPINNSRT